MTDSNILALILINEANSDTTLEEKVSKVQRYLETLVTSALEHAYPIDNYVEGMPLYSEVVESFDYPKFNGRPLQKHCEGCGSTEIDTRVIYTCRHCGVITSEKK